MLLSEARWFGRRIEKLSTAAFPMLNVGSQTRAFRSRIQPWIDRYLFRPADAKGYTVLHTDLQAADGVDLVGDLMDAEFVARLRQQSFRSVLCCNLLEHVEDPRVVAEALTAIVADCGYLLVSVPHLFPYHADPIDTMYRPTPAELASIFPGTEVVEAEIVNAGTLLSYAMARFFSGPADLLAGLLRRHRHISHGDSAERGSVLRMVPWLTRRLKVSCVILRKIAA
jgi:hypothetical protein